MGTCQKLVSKQHQMAEQHRQAASTFAGKTESRESGSPARYWLLINMLVKSRDGAVAVTSTLTQSQPDAF